MEQILITIYILIVLTTSNQTSSTCETWRIIGVFNGKLKLIRGSQIGTYSWG